MSAGKGDTRRPAAVDEQTIADAWARTFGQCEEPRPIVLGHRELAEALQRGWACALPLLTESGAESNRRLLELLDAVDRPARPT